MKRIILSLGAITFVAALAISASGAFFSDTETSTGNTFTAGSIDLTVDSTQHYNNAICVPNTNTVGFHWQLVGDAQPDQYPVINSACDGTWTATNLGPTNKFFNFGDVKPADTGEDTVSMHLVSNPAWACADISLTGNADNGINGPESLAGDTTDGAFAGELAQNLSVFIWNDSGVDNIGAGDNIYETGEKILTNPESLSTLLGGNVNGPATTSIALADATTLTGPLGAGSDSHIGIEWCAGTFTGTPGNNLACDGTSMGNNAQTDSATANITLRVSQSRNQPNFTCATGVVAGDQTIVVQAGDLDPSGNAGPVSPAAALVGGKWFMYDDNADKVDNTLGSFVTGPATPPLGTKSVQFTLGATSVADRDDIATYQFQGTLLSSISTLAFSAYSHNGSGGAGATESPYLVFDVDFATSTLSGYEGRLVYVPSANGGVPQDTWNSYNTTTGLWNWSHFAANGNKWPDGNTTPNRTWSDIVSSFPGIHTLSPGGLLGVRVGEPGPTNYVGNIDKFQINTGSGLKTYDFGN